MEVNKEFTYTFAARWTEDGKPRVVEQKLAVRGGQTFEVDLFGDEISSDERNVLELVHAERV